MEFDNYFSSLTIDDDDGGGGGGGRRCRSLSHLSYRCRMIGGSPGEVKSLLIIARSQ